MYKDALMTLEPKFGQSQAVMSAHWDNLCNFPPMKMHKSDIINYSGCISSLDGVFKSLSYDLDLKSAALLNTAVKKIPPKMNELWSLFTLKTHWVKPTLLDFNDWLKETAKAHNLMKTTATKTKSEDSIKSVTKSKSIKSICHKYATEESPEVTAKFANNYFNLHCRSGSVVRLQKNFPRSEPRLWLKSTSVSPVCVTNTCLGNALVLVIVGKMAEQPP